MSVYDRIEDACEEIGEFGLHNVKLEDADPILLDMSDGDLNRHVAMQPAAVAYYSALKKSCKRRMDHEEESYDIWMKKKYSAAKASLEVGTQKGITGADIKARIVVDNEEEMEAWRERLADTRRQFDNVESWCEGWVQKSFMLNGYISIEKDERGSGTGSLLSKDDDERGNVGSVRKFLNKTGAR